MSILHAGNTSTDPDGIPPQVSKKAWPIYKKQITCLFQHYLEERYYPYIFQNATLCVLLKSGKDSHLLPQLYRFITLLSCLVKVLERVVARRLVYIALKYKIFSSLNFGITP